MRLDFGEICLLFHGLAKENGKEVLGSIQEMPGDIHITNGDQGQVKIKRIEA